MSESTFVIEFERIDDLLDRFVEVWEAGGYEQGADSIVGWETWKWDYRQHLQDEFLSDHDITALEAADITPLLEVLNEPIGIGTPIPVFMLGGGANGGIAWQGFKEISVENSTQTAELLSFFFDPDEDIEERLEAFQDYYGSVNTAPGSLLALGGCLLMFVHPSRYIHYKWTQMREFFAAFSEYTVNQGFDADQYRALNEACEQLLDRLRGRVAEPSMLHVQTLIWSWKDVLTPNDVAIDSLREKAPEGVGFYWVNQTHDEEFEGEYLRSKDTKWQRDLTVLQPGDIVFHYSGQQLRGCSVVESEAYQEEYDGDQHHFVDLQTEWFTEPLPLEDVRDVLLAPKVKEGQDRYPLDKNGNVMQAYLCHLSPVAGMYLLETAGMEVPKIQHGTRYFWVNASRTDWHHDGGEVFYEITNRRNPEALRNAQPGDKVLVYQVSPIQQIVGRAHVDRELHEEPVEGPDEYEEGITLRWDDSLDGAKWHDVKSDSELQESQLVESDNNFVITELTQREYERIIELGEISRFSDFEDQLAVPESDITVPQQQLHFPEGEWERLQSRLKQALANGNHVLLFGPPGTGKTKLAQQVCEATVGTQQFELVTASADWSTFDTVGGYQTTSQNTLAFKPGIILDRFQDDQDGSPTNEWLIIDELNRADIDKAFGSLFSALTGESVTLPFDSPTGEPIQILDSSREHEEVTENRFFIPEDWRMLATMNTLDKTSLYEMSYAFMRRWAFIPVGIPDLPERNDGDESELASLVGDYVQVWATNGDVRKAEHHYERVGRIWRAVNEYRAIGPAIVEDIYEYVAPSPSPQVADYVSPLIMYVFPQLEGLRRSEIEELLERLDTIVEDDTDELWTVARDFFQVDLHPSSDG